jgi:hypothetical protein
MDSVVKTPTITQVIDKFNELRTKYYNPEGYMISTIPDNIAQNFIDSNSESIWTQNYNRHVSEKVQILSATVAVDVFGRNFNVRFDRPCKAEHRSEFETYFGFGGHCSGYTDKRVIACFPSCMADEKEVNVDELLRSAATENGIDDTYVECALSLLILGGYVKYWDAYYEFSEWFASFNTFTGMNIKTSDIVMSYIFKTMVLC